ncbi:HupE/UreJ family protein [Actinoplanes sp. NPDC026619]|uniref:HupE/UreJ family protein n=1 Tax=Actinoplanes sp. NPDC026619 TaxID=3155798 RepID=UPI0033D0CCD8
MRLVLLIASVLIVLLPASPASAHPMSTTAILLDTAPDRVTGVVELPIDRLEVALAEPLTATTVLQSAKLEELRRYVLAHTSAGTWTVGLTGGRVQKVDNVDHLVFDITLVNDKTTNLELTYDAILHKIVSHQVFVAARPVGQGDYTTIGILDWRTHTVTVPVAAPASAGTGFVAALRLGVRHISQGADHLLFLIMLLLPAPLLARRRRWVPGGDLRRQGLRVAHVVTAFAVGHSITLALAALGYLSVPARPVEALIALSVLVSAVHAIRPLVPGGEAWIAAGFGLMHGFAFATLIGGLGLTQGSLLTNLLGFNLGIELTQLIVVALVMPSLLVLARTRAYPWIRLGLAATGAVLATAWFAERTTLIATNPLDGVANQLVAHPFVIAALLAATAATSVAVPRLRATLNPATPDPAR